MERVDLLQNKVSGAFAKEAATSTAIQACARPGSNGQAYKNADRVLFITGEITSAGSKEYFNEIVKKELGITNFDRDKLNVGRNAAVTHVSFLYDTVPAAGNTEDWKEIVKTLAFDKAAPGALLNAETRFEDDVKPLIELPVFEMHNTETTQTNDQKFRALGDLRILEAEKSFQFHINVPSGKTGLDVATNRHFFKLVMRVGETVPR
ncbi:hypothetical protein [Bizionia paragorgiae]|uniref:Uncharacterized protein n=1 Tax=Bizionia paragorgiae TaxID=283786 RepID=A0A1H3YMP1_BIZPA|nr:hypothetical protein [Bizionia paragorgiae]SEA12810.1 hypothetical protein SAMN04487990_1077 [Bizionia paragorgiae]